MSKTIMTVDNSPDARLVISETLRSDGYDVIEAADGEDALTKLTPAVDMIITDLNMPGMGGIELIRSIRNSGPKRLIPIVMLTSESQGAKKAEGKAAGASGWIMKPFKPEQIKTVVKRILR